MICPHCRQEISGNAKFCTRCGKRIPRCPTCGMVLTKRSRFCTNDGTAIPEDVLALFPDEPGSANETAEKISAVVSEVLSETSVPAEEPPVEPAPAEVPPEEPPAEPAPAEVLPEDPFKESVPEEEPPAEPPKPVSLVKTSAPPPEIPRQRFCVRCGRPCPDGQNLCGDCLAAQTAAPAPQKKNKLVPILLALLCVVLVAAAGTAGYMAAKRDQNSRDEDEDSRIDSRRDDDGSADTREESGDRWTAPEESQETQPVVMPSEPETEPAPVEYIHSYEVIAGDLSWQEAKTACEARGGYLASITSEEEYQQICQLASASGLTYLWLGASLHSETDTWENNSWITDEAWTFARWYPGEPSRADADGTMEFYLCMWNAKYDGEEIGWTFNDQRNNILEVIPTASGRVGYVCEYETAR